MKAFVDAFNAGNVDAMAACLAEDAWAEVVDAPFPREQGRSAIRRTSFSYLLGQDLTAESESDEILLRDSSGAIDMSLRYRTRDGLMTEIRYFTRAHGHAPP
jgi:hypothetical protein